MRLIRILCIIFIFIIFPSLTVEAHELEDDYHTYVEIVMSTGKLMRDFTKEDNKEAIKRLEGLHFIDILIEPVNVNVFATYISNTLFSVENDSESSMSYEVDLTIETNNKITFSADYEIEASGKGTIEAIKAEASSKSNIGFNAQSSKSVKEVKKTKINVEAGSRAIIYLTGEMSITNGVVAVYRLFYRVCSGGYEFITLKSQYARIEMAKI